MKFGNMKHLLPFLLLGAIMFFATGCSGQKSNPSNSESAGNRAVEVSMNSTDNSFFMLRDDKLPCSVPTDLDISQLDYYQLRLLRAYLYAIHGHWFMEEDLNSFFGTHTDWYYSLCYQQWAYWDWPDTVSVQQQVLARGYNDLLLEDYEKSYGMIALTDEEKSFVARIDERMKQIKGNKYVENEQGDKLWDPQQIVNYHKFYHPSAEFLQRLGQSNLAFEPTRLEQLFNVYEENEYRCLPHFVTTDVFLQAYHMLNSYELKVLENGTMSLCLYNSLVALIGESQDALSVCPELQLHQDFFNLAYYDVALRLLSGDSVHHVLKVDEYLGDMKPVVEGELRNVAQCEDALSPLFQTEINFGYGQFKPRGHYTRKESAMRYFRAMMWLQKGCFFQEDPMQLSQAMWMAYKLSNVRQAYAQLKRVDGILRYWIGEPDNVSIMELADYMVEKGIRPDVSFSEEQTKQVNDWLTELFKSRNRIKSTRQDTGLMQNQINFMPQRYTLDGELLGRLFDDTPNAEKAFPNGVEVLDSIDAVNRSGEFSKGFYEGQNYNERLRLLSLVRRKDVRVPTPKGMQPFEQTQAWEKKNLNTALASWSLLKHDAVLYTEQPDCAECGGGDQLPDPRWFNYVEPNETFWNKLKDILEREKRNIPSFANKADAEHLVVRIGNLLEMVSKCCQMAKCEKDGSSLDRLSYRFDRIGSELEYFTLSVLDPDQEIVEWHKVSGTDRNVAQVADVFTRDVLGCEKNGILYEATGAPNIIYVVVEINGEFYLTRGATYSYYEFVRPLGDRLTDEQWQQMMRDCQAPSQPDWFAPLLIGEPVEVDERYIYSSGC